MSTLGQMEWLDTDSPNGMPLVESHHSLTLLTLHGYGFFETIAEEGAQKGRSDFSAPNIFMADLGTTLDQGQYLNLDITLTSDLWTLPSIGTPELLQIGGYQSNGEPFLDAAQPFSSPLMGLTLSDSFALSDANHVIKIFAAPRGESTDGPVDFTRRLTGVVNPDAPLGYLIQDAGDVSNSVLGASLKMGGFHLESSVFNGSLPNSTQVDLPLGPINSVAVRAIQEFSRRMMLMASYAWVGTPQPGIANDQRYSISLYTNVPITDTWSFYNTLVYGGVTHIDNSSSLNSFLDEILFSNGEETDIFARLEYLQRTPNELGILNSPNEYIGQWVSAVSIGYSHRIAAWDGWELRAGLMISNDQVPFDYQTAYSGNPFTYQFFFQLGGTQSYKL